MKRLCLLIVALMTLSAGAETPEGRVKAFYDWYLQSGEQYRRKFPEAKPHFEGEFFELVRTGLQRRPKDGFWVDFDPFVNAQMPATRVKIGKAQRDVNLAQVKVTPILSRGGEAPTFKVYLVQRGSDWKIQNFVYDGFTLRNFLQEGLKSN